MTILYPLAPSRARPERCPASLWADFWPLLATPDTDVELARWSERGWLDLVLPEWQRQRGPLNTQHQTHDFALDVHSLAVLAGTKRSRYYAGLSEREKQLTATAALFHDIAKSGGRPEQRLQLIPDWHHPTKGIMVARRRLPQWGFSRREIEWVCRLVRHHQLFGRMIMRYSKQEGPLPAATLSEAATLLLCEPVLDMLLPLTEGDIRGVKGESALFTPLVQEKLAEFSGLVREKIRTMEAARRRVLPEESEGLASRRFYLSRMVMEQAIDRCACGWPLQEDGALVWVTDTSEQAGPDAVEVEVLPEHILWAVREPIEAMATLGAGELRQQLMGETPLASGYTVQADTHWVLAANPMLCEP